MKKFGYFLLLTLILPLLAGGNATALTASQLSQVQNDTLFYTGNSCSTQSSNNSPTPVSTVSVGFNNNAAQAIAKADSVNGTQVGYALYTSKGQQIAAYNDTFENYGAAITKPMLLVAYLNQLGSTTLSSTAKKDLTAMIENSSDSASNAIYGMLKNPQPEILAVAKKAGMTGFKYNDTADSIYYLGQSQITAQDFAKFFSQIDTMFPQSQKSFALSLLDSIKQQYGLLQAGLPGQVYSKEGWKPEPGGGTDPAISGNPNPFGIEGNPYVVNQAAQFTSKGMTYGIAFTVGGTADMTSGQSIIKNIASALISEKTSTPTQQKTTSLASNGCGCSSTATTASVVLTGSDNGQKVWNYFLSSGYDTNQVAAIVGNLDAQDSLFDPELSQAGGDSTTPTSQNDVGWGLAQWTPTNGGANPIYAAAQAAGVPNGELDTLSGQLQIISYGMTHQSPPGYVDMAAALKQQTSIYSATSVFYQQYEGGGSAPTTKVYNDALNMLSVYGGGSSSSGITQASASSNSSSSSSNCGAAFVPNINCNSPGATASALNTVRQNVVCIAQQQLAVWEAQPGYPWSGANPYSESAYEKYTYSGQTQEEWCADFASWVYKQAGFPLSSSYWDLPAVSEIYKLGLQNKNFHFYPASSNYVPVPGDLAIYLWNSDLANPNWAQSHVNIFISSSGGTNTYIGGDQGNGPYPGGSVVSTMTASGNYSFGLVGYVAPK